MKLSSSSIRFLILISSFFPLFMPGQARSFQLLGPSENPSRKDKIEVVGVVPDNVTVEVETTWETTTNFPGCRRLVPLVGSFPKVVYVPVQLGSQVGHQWSWTVWRDNFKTGNCGWQLREILTHSDKTVSGLPVSRSSNIPSRIAYVCRHNDNCEKDILKNDDTSNPVHLYCKYSVLRNVPKNIFGGINPCAGWSEHRGTDGKLVHYLQPDQHQIGFIINDLETHN
jgi:hypothetical protein